MFVITLRLADKTKAPQFMDGHNAWIKRGFDDGAFLLVGSFQPNAGGAILAHNASPEEIEARVQDDPFVARARLAPKSLCATPQAFQRPCFSAAPTPD